MKKLSLFLILFFISIGFSFGQSQRLVLLEEFTSATCGPCVAANTKIHGWLINNPTVFTAIFYHMSWPAPGNDPMYLANTVDNNARRSYYNVNAVPNSVVDGNVYNGNGNSLQWSVISNRHNVPSPFEISLQHTISPAQDEISLVMVALATQAVSGNLVAHNVVIEKTVHFTSPPGTNGETNFDHVMKKMLPTKDGTSLPDFEVGDYVIIETSWPFEPSQVYDIDELMAVGFVQNNTSKEVYQAANSSTGPLTLPYDRDIQVLQTENVSSTNCSGVVAPMVTVRNNGNNTITSFNLNYEVNGGTVMTESWSGSLDPLEKVVVNLPDYTFTPESTNTLTIFSDDPNSNADEYPKNDTLNISIEAAQATTLTMILFIKTDNAPEETTWDVQDAEGNIVDSGGPYTESNHIYRDTIYLTDEGCYTFTIYDAGGNGICCTNGNGFYLLQDNQNTQVIMSGPFGSFEKTEFNANVVSARDHFDQTRALQVFPNPANDLTTATFYLVDPDKVELNLYNTFGQKVRNWQPGYLGAGDHEVKIDAGKLAPGVYILQLTTGNKVYTRKISVSR
ncbi:MAG: T9SS C-terminal target domain-containing protein [Bacteroidetes bacterium]|nr:MAG: T9SS C-terminal target domain-containing protein [Bacteroidota bacterium]